MKVNKIDISNFLSFFVARSVGLILSVLLARHLSIPDFADYLRIQLWISFIPFFFFGMMNGFPITAPKYRDSPEDFINLKSSYFWTSLLVTIPIGIGILIAPLSITLQLKLIIISYLILSKVLEMLILFAVVNFEFKKQTLIKLFFDCIAILSSLILFLKLRTIEAYFLGAIGSYIVALIIFREGFLKLKFNIDFKLIKNLVAVGFPVFVIWFLDYSFRNLDKYFLSTLYEDHTFATYGFTQNLSFSVWTATMSIMGPKAQYMIHDFVKGNFKEGFQYLKNARKFSRNIALLLSAGCLLFYYFITEFYIQKYRGSLLLMTSMLAGAFFLIDNNYNIYAMTALKKAKTLLKFQIYIAILSVLINIIIFYFKWPIEAYAISTCLSLMAYDLILRRKLLQIEKLSEIAK